MELCQNATRFPETHKSGAPVYRMANKRFTKVDRIQGASK